MMTMSTIKDDKIKYLKEEVRSFRDRKLADTSG